MGEEDLGVGPLITGVEYSEGVLSSSTYSRMYTLNTLCMLKETARISGTLHLGQRVHGFKCLIRPQATVYSVHVNDYRS